MSTCYLRATDCFTNLLSSRHLKIEIAFNLSFLCFFLDKICFRQICPLQELEQLDTDTWLRSFVVAKRSFGMLVSVQPPEISPHGARAVGLVYQNQIGDDSHGYQIGCEVPWMIWDWGRGWPWQNFTSRFHEVKVRVLNVDLEKQKLALSMKVT